jgi:hypothetical protein
VPRTPSPVETITFESGSKLRELNGEAFFGCDSLKSICLPASLETIYSSSFPHCRGLRIEIESGNKFYRVFSDFVMDLNGQAILRYFGNDSEIE